MLTVSAIVPLFPQHACLTLLSSLLFLYSHFLIKQNISPLDVTGMDSCAGGRGENQPQDMSKSEISSPKIRRENLGVCEGWEGDGDGGRERERERREGAQRGEIKCERSTSTPG